MNRYVIAKRIAPIASVFSIIGFFMADKGNDFGYLVLGVGVLLTIVAYLFGGLFTMMKASATISIAIWRIIPFFPFDLFMGLFGMVVSMAVFFFLPIIPISIAKSKYGLY